MKEHRSPVVRRPLTSSLVTALSRRSAYLALFVASAVLAYGLIGAWAGASGPGSDAQAGVLESTAAPAPRDADRQETETAESPLPAPLDDVESGPLLVLTGHIEPRGSLARALHDHGVPPGVVHDLTVAMKPVFDFRNARAGDFYALIRDGEESVQSLEYHRGRRTVYRLVRGEGGTLVPSELEIPLERRVSHLGGVIERSLFEAVLELGERPELVHQFADVFSWDFDFSSQTRPGDEFRMVFEKFYDREGFVRYGRILAAQYRAADHEFVAIYFDDDDGYGDHYTPGGNSVRRTFLRAPVRYSRISSRYTKSRLHPILNVRRSHLGIDYAAPIGTPVWAVGDGRVIFKGWSGGLGRLLKVKHPNGYVSYYGHLSRYAKGLEVGDRVAQKQVIGYVGSSGLSTGPHLHYTLKKNGRFVDPLRVKFPKGEPIPVKSREAFEEKRDMMLAELRLSAPAMVLEAGM